MLGIYGQFLRVDPVLTRDDQLLLRPLETLSSLSEYPALLKSEKNLDVQPVRDLSLYADIRLKEHIPFHSFHLTNLILWMLILSLSFLILRLCHPDTQLVFSLILLYSVHPVFVGSVAWISARKHLLSCLFILIATYVFMKSIKSKSSFLKSASVIQASYLLSIFSHPISALWPLWALCFGLKGMPDADRKKAFWLAVICLPAMLFCLFLNYRYYTEAYVIRAAAEKISTSPDATLGFTVLALGRYLINFLAPFKIAPIYYLGSPWNMIGTILIPIFVYVLSKSIPLAALCNWGLLYLLPLLMVTLKPTNIFVSDTYFLIPGIAILNLLAYFLAGNSWFRQIPLQLKRALLVATAGVFIYLSLDAAQLFRSNRDFTMGAYKKEATPTTLVYYAEQSLNDGYFGKAFESILKLQLWDPSHPDFTRLLSKALYLDPKPSPQDKIKFLESQHLDDPYITLALAQLYAQEKHFQEAFTLLNDLLFKGPKKIPKSIEFSTVVAHFIYYCSKSKPEKYCNEMLKKVRKETTKEPWNQAAYTSRLNHLVTDDIGLPFLDH